MLLLLLEGLFHHTDMLASCGTFPVFCFMKVSVKVSKKDLVQIGEIFTQKYCSW